MHTFFSRHIVVEAHTHSSKKALGFTYELQNLNGEIIWLGSCNVYCHDPNTTWHV